MPDVNVFACTHGKTWFIIRTIIPSFSQYNLLAAQATPRTSRPLRQASDSSVVEANFAHQPVRLTYLPDVKEIPQLQVR